MKIENYFKAIQYKLGECSPYGWDCFGNHAHFADYFANDTTDDVSISCVYDTNTQVVYLVEMWDYPEGVVYRWIDPEYIELFNQELNSRGITPEVEYDDLRLVEIEVEDDILEKIACIALCKKYDTRIQVPLDLPDDLLVELMRLAHAQDITLNQLVGNAITASLEKYKEIDDE